MVEWAFVVSDPLPLDLPHDWPRVTFKFISMITVRGGSHRVEAYAIDLWLSCRLVGMRERGSGCSSSLLLTLTVDIGHNLFPSSSSYSKQTESFGSDPELVLLPVLLWLLHWSPHEALWQHWVHLWPRPRLGCQLGNCSERKMERTYFRTHQSESGPRSRLLGNITKLICIRTYKLFLSVVANGGSSFTINSILHL